MSATSEPRLVSIASAAGPYEVLIGAGQLAAALSEDPSVVIADRFFERHLDAVPASRLILVDASEERKTLSTVEELVIGMRSAGLRRDGTMLAVGGGVVQDVATMAAQIYMRGVRWSLVPTTLMSMADSCVGGKSSINVGNTKNLVGGFYPPTTIHIDPVFTDTLAPVDRACGLLEAVKIAYCRGSNHFDAYLAAASDDSHVGLTELLTLTLEAKRWFIEIDEFDHAERRILNFGHTFGHALEAGAHYAAKHGIAVGIGMLASLHFVAADRPLTPQEEQLGAYVLGLLLEVVDLAALSERVDWDDFRAAFDSDKKHNADGYRLILPAAGDLGAELRSFDRSESSLLRVESALVAALEGKMP